MRVFVLDKLEDGVVHEKIAEKLQRYYQMAPDEAKEYVQQVCASSCEKQDT